MEAVARDKIAVLQSQIHESDAERERLSSINEALKDERAALEKRVARLLAFLRASAILCAARATRPLSVSQLGSAACSAGLDPLVRLSRFVRFTMACPPLGYEALQLRFVAYCKEF